MISGIESKRHDLSRVQAYLKPSAMLLPGSGPTGHKAARFLPRHPSAYLVIAATAAAFLFFVSVGYETAEDFHRTTESWTAQSQAHLAADSSASSSMGLAGTGGHWISTWTSAQQACPLHEEVLPFGSLIPTDFVKNGIALADTTIRQTVMVSLGGDEIRIRLSNAFGQEALGIDKASIARPVEQTIDGRPGLAGSSEIDPSTLQMLTFAGHPRTVIPVGGQVLSDPIKFPVATGEVISLTTYLDKGQQSEYITCHMDSRTSVWLIHGDYAAQTTLPGAVSDSPTPWYFFSAVEIWKPLDYHTVVVLGDSITDASAALKNANNRWTQRVFDRLQESDNDDFQKLAIVNQAISGNQLINGGVGQNLNARLDRDTVAISGTKYVVVHEGIIDVGSGREFDEVLIQLRQVTSRLHAAGITVFGATIHPFSCIESTYPQGVPWKGHNQPEREERRLKVNWEIRNNGVYDGFIDFDAMLRDPSNTTEARPDFRGMDCVHPNPLGMQVMANHFPIDIFERFKDGFLPGDL